MVMVPDGVLGSSCHAGTKTDVAVRPDTILSVFIVIPLLRMVDSQDTIVWRGNPANASFIVSVACRTSVSRGIKVINSWL